MKRLTILAVAGLVLSAGIVSAQVPFHMVVSSVYGTNATISGNGGGAWEHAGSGMMQGTLTINGVQKPMTGVFCVDLAHSFSINGTENVWDGQRYIVPPDPSEPPPWDTQDAAYAYHHWKANWTTVGTAQQKQEWASGVQLALWEITQNSTFDPNNPLSTGWRGEYNSHSNWWSYGQFQYSMGGYFNANAFANATAILSTMWGYHEMRNGGSLYYYDPSNNQNHAQGLVGDSDVPEPGSLLLLGTALLAGVGVAWRRRGQS